MSLIKTKIPQSITINSRIITTINNRYGEYLSKRYSVNNITDFDWYSSLLSFMLHPYEERIDYHNLRNNNLISLWENENDGIDFLINNIVINVGKDLNLFDYYFQTKSQFIDISNIGDSITDNGRNDRTITENNDSYRMDEISPLNADIDSINTPTNKSENNFSSTKSDNDTSSNTKTISSFEKIKDFIDFVSFSKYESDCMKFIDSLVLEYNTIY